MINKQIIKEIQDFLAAAGCLDQFVVNKRKSMHKTPDVDIWADYAIMNDSVKSLRDFVFRFSNIEISFSWGNTEEGYSYWQNIYSLLREKYVEVHMKTITSRFLLLSKRLGIYKKYIEYITSYLKERHAYGLVFMYGVTSEQDLSNDIFALRCFTYNRLNERSGVELTTYAADIFARLFRNKSEYLAIKKRFNKMINGPR